MEEAEERLVTLREALRTGDTSALAALRAGHGAAPSSATAPPRPDAVPRLSFSPDDVAYRSSDEHDEPVDSSARGASVESRSESFVPELDEDEDEESAWAPGSPTGRQGTDLMAAKKARRPPPGSLLAAPPPRAVVGPPDSPDGLAAGGVLSSPTAPDPRVGAIDLGAAGGVDAAREAVELARMAPHQASTLREVFAPLQALTRTQNSQQHALRGDAEMPPNLQESHQDMSSGSGPIPTSIYTVSLQQAGLGVLCRVWAAFCSEHGEAPSREEALALTRTLIGSTWLRGKRPLALTRAAGKPLLDPSARVLIRMRYGRTLYCRAKPSMAL